MCELYVVTPWGSSVSADHQLFLQDKWVETGAESVGASVSQALHCSPTLLFVPPESGENHTCLKEGFGGLNEIVYQLPVTL